MNQCNPLKGYKGEETSNGNNAIAKNNTADGGFTLKKDQAIENDNKTNENDANKILDRSQLFSVNSHSL